MQGAPAAAPPQVPQQGAGPATAPVPNRGLEAVALAQLSGAVRQLEKIGAALPITSEAGKAVREAVLKLAKHVPAGSVAPGVEKAALMEQIQKLQQIGPMAAAMRGGAGGVPQGRPSQAA